MEQLRLKMSSFPARELAAPGKRQLVSEAVLNIYNGETDRINKTLFELYNKNYHDAVGVVYGKQSGGLPQMFKINLSRLAAAKAFWATTELVNNRVDIDGVIRSLEEYKMVADGIIKTYNRHQVTEYNTIVNRCRTAKQFERFKETAHIFPNLKWLLTRSLHPREIHLALVDLILPIEHPFWLDNQPGNLYNCKCDWTQTDEPVSKNIPDGIAPDKGLEGNPAITEEIFTDKHPYFDVIRDRFRHIPDMGELMNPDDIAYIKKTTENGKNYLEHSLVRKESGIEKNREIVSKLLDNGYSTVKLLPQIYANQKELRERYYGKEYSDSHETKCPDALIDGVLIEFKNTNIHNMSRFVAKAAEQSNVVLLNLNETVTEDYINRFVNGQFAMKDRHNITQIIIITGDKVYAFDRKAKAEQ